MPGAKPSESFDLTVLTAHHRGFEFERFLNEVFTSFHLVPRGSFRITGEQIDGSLQFQGETYLVEAKLQNHPAREADLLTFAGKVAGKAKWSRGLFISYSGFSKDGLEAFARGKPTQVICMDGLDFHYIFEGTLDLNEILERKARRAVETNEAFVSVRELFAGLPKSYVDQAVPQVEPSKPESTEGVGRVSVLKRQEGAPLNLG